MTSYSSPRDLAKYLSIARKHLTEDKVKAFETAYRRLHDRAVRWDESLRETISDGREKPAERSDIPPTG